MAAGDNVASQWGHQLDEWREPLPWDLINAYPRMIDEWVFGHFGDLLDADLTPAQ